MFNDTQILDGISIFAAVVQAGSFTRAAENTGHSNSHISKTLNKLEERLGIRLLHRTTRSLTLTHEGETYYRHCENILNEAQEALDTLQGGQTEPQGKLRVSCPVSFGLSKLRPVISDFVAQYPGIELDLDLSDRRVDLVAEGFDIAIRASAELDDSSLIARPLMRSSGLILASPDYLEKHGTPSSPQELSSHQCITYTLLKTLDVWPFIDENGNQQEIRVNSRIQTNSPEMELSLCLAGQGIIRLPEFNLRGELERGELVEIFSDLPPFPIQVYLVYPSRKHMATKVRRFIEFVQQALGD